MDYLTLYGNYYQQKQDLLELEFELFCRKLMLIAHLSNEFNKYDCELNLTVEHEFKKLYFSISKEEHKPKYQGMISLLLTIDEYELPNQFVEDNNEILNILFKLEDEFDYQLLLDKKIKNIPINLNDTYWLESIFSLCDKKYEFSKFMSKYLNINLSEKNNNKIVLKV